MNISLSVEELAKRNKAFHRMSKKRQRIAIAKDVLSQIKAKKFLGFSGRYLTSPILERRAREAIQKNQLHNFDLQQELLVSDAECNVCGIGAAFCSLARLGDEVEYTSIGIEMRENLVPIFGAPQLELIECAFEGSPLMRDLVSAKQTKATLKFYDRWSKNDRREDDNKRLAAIFRNIVRNEGTFKP